MLMPAQVSTSHLVFYVLYICWFLPNFGQLTPLEIRIGAEFVEKSLGSLHIRLERVFFSIFQATLHVGVEAFHAPVEYAAINNSI